MHPLLLLTTSSAIVGESSPRLRTAAVSPVLRTAVPVLRRTARAPAPVALADDGGGGLLATLESFQSSHALLISILVAIGTRYIISEVRYRFEKPVMDELGNRVATELKPDTDRIDGLAWAKLAGCVALDLAGDASELVPVLGELTDVAFAPAEAGLLWALFKSPLVSGFGFLEEILPFTDVVPTFCIGWCLQNLWPTTPMARRLGISKA